MRDLTMAVFATGLLGAAACVAIPSREGFKLAPPPAKPVSDVVVTKLETRSVIGNTVAEEAPLPSRVDPEHGSEATHAPSSTPNSSKPTAALPPPAKRPTAMKDEMVREAPPAEQPAAILFGNPLAFVVPGLVPPQLFQRIKRGESRQSPRSADHRPDAHPRAASSGITTSADGHASGRR